MKMRKNTILEGNMNLDNLMKKVLNLVDETECVLHDLKSLTKVCC